MVGSLGRKRQKVRREMADRATETKLVWQSKAVLLLVVPLCVIAAMFQGRWWFQQVPVVGWTTVAISGLFGMVVWKLRAGTATAAATGAVITACLMFGTTQFPYEYSWLHGGLLPLLAVFLLTFVATKAGKARKDNIGVSEGKRGRNAAQVAANLGLAGLITAFPIALFSSNPLLRNPLESISTLMLLTALAEAAADTVSSEIGQAFGGQPRMITTLRRVMPGTDGGMTILGTLAGGGAAFLVVAVGFLSLRGVYAARYWVPICPGENGGRCFWIAV